MSVRRLDPNQPEHFEFTPENLTWAEELVKKYPEGRQASAVIPLLWRAQEQNDGWVSEPAIRKVAEMLDMAFIRVLEVATFYTMFQLSPVGRKAHVQVCGTTPCMLRGAEDLKDVCRRRIAATPHELSEDGDFSWEEVECLGACVNAPMVQIFKDTYEDLTPETLEAVLDAFARGEYAEPGPQIDRQFSAPATGPTTLTDPSLYDGSGGSGTVAAEPAEPVETEPEPADTPASSADGEDADEVSLDDEARPEALETPREGNPDDLKRISGVGPKLEGVLNGLGIYHFDQIAAWTPDNVAWIDGYLSFKGRVEREQWIPQARELAGGGETEFSARMETTETADAESSDEAGS